MEAQTKIRNRVLRLKHGRAQHLAEGGLCRRERRWFVLKIMIPRGDTNEGCCRNLECRGMVLGAGNDEGLDEKRRFFCGN